MVSPPWRKVKVRIKVLSLVVAESSGIIIYNNIYHYQILLHEILHGMMTFLYLDLKSDLDLMSDLYVKYDLDLKSDLDVRSDV